MNLQMEQRLLACRTLPSLPGVALRVLELAQEPELRIVDLARVIAPDPALTAKVLRIASSPLYGHRRRVENLHQALVVLGSDGAICLALSFSLIGKYAAAATPGIDYARFWRRSLLTALGSRSLGRHLGLRDTDELFLAGLLQDIGMLAMDRALGPDYAKAIAGAEDHAATLALEQAAFGTDHAEVGAWLAERWKLPGYLVPALRASHDPGLAEHEPRARGLVGCVSSAALLAEVWLQDDGGAAARRAAVWVRGVLGLGREVVSDTLAEVSREAGEFAEVLDLEPFGAQCAEAVIEQAREALLVRSLHQIQRVERRQRRAAQPAGNGQARRDPVTGLMRPADTARALAQAMEEADGLGWPLGIVALRIDGLAGIAGAHGLRVAEQVQRSVVATLEAGLREGDRLGLRADGGLLLVLPGVDAPRLRHLVRRLARELGAAPHGSCKGENLMVSAAAGQVVHTQQAPFADADAAVLAAEALISTQA